MSENIKQWFTELLNKKNTFMALVGWVIIVSFIILIFYQIIQVNYFFGKSKIYVEVYERMIKECMTYLKELGMIALMYYFGNKMIQNEKI
jgi:hypothetical protein